MPALKRKISAINAEKELAPPTKAMAKRDLVIRKLHSKPQKGDSQMKNQKQRFLKEIAGTETARKWQKETANADRLWRDKKIRTLSWKD